MMLGLFFLCCFVLFNINMLAMFGEFGRKETIIYMSGELVFGASFVLSAYTKKCSE
jgi:hypothetical protein